MQHKTKRKEAILLAEAWVAMDWKGSVDQAASLTIAQALLDEIKPDRKLITLLDFLETACWNGARRYRVSYKLPGASKDVPGWIAQLVHEAVA